jgi:hypothetical protein
MQQLVHTIPTLKQLDIKFRNERWDIWENAVHSPRDAALIHRKFVVTCILTFAVPSLCHISRVQLEGHVGQETVDSFSKQLQDYRASAHARNVYGHTTQLLVQCCFQFNLGPEWMYVISTDGVSNQD